MSGSHRAPGLSPGGDSQAHGFRDGKDAGTHLAVTGKQPRTASPLPAYRDEFAAVKEIDRFGLGVARLAEDPDPRVRLGLAIALGDSKPEFAVRRWPRSLSAMSRSLDAGRCAQRAGGREVDFLRALCPS